MSQNRGQPSGGAGYPAAGQDSFPQLAKPGQSSAPQAPYPNQANSSIKIPPPRPAPPGSGHSQAPYPGQGQAPYPGQGQGQAPYPGHSQAPYPGQGQTPYPGQGQTPYPGQGQSPYPGQGQAPNTGQGQTPYPGQAPNAGPGQTPYPGQAPNVGQGQTPYPGQAPNAGHGQTPYPGQAPNVGQGQTPYPGQAPNTGQGQPPYPGHAPYPGQGQTPYPGQAPNASQGQTPYPGQAPNAGQGQTPYPGQAPNAGQGQTPYPGQGATQYPARGQAPPPPQGVAPHQGQGQAPYQGQVPYQGQGQAPYQGQGQGQTPYQGSQIQSLPPGHAPKYGVDEYKSKVEIRIECKSLLNKDIMSKSDPCAAMYMMKGGRWEEVGRTENVMNCLDPKFARSLVVNYFFEEVQKVLIAVYDVDNSTPQLTDDDFLGQIKTTLGELVSNTPFTTPLLLRNGRKAGQGTILIRTEEIKKGGENLTMTFRAQKLDKKDLFGKSDPYLEISRATTDFSWQTVHRTEVIKNNLNPTWRSFELPLQTLCGGDKQQKIKFDCYDWDSDGSHDFIGSFTCNIEEMVKAEQQEVSWPVINHAKKAKKKNYTNSGCVYLSSCKITKEYSFLDFITNGTQINFTVGIDFTASNGSPSQSTSLHYFNPYQPNEYMAAIKAVGEVCQDYDFDKLFPALGFGAKIPPQMSVSHEFAINFNPQNPYCQGIDGVLRAYSNCIQQVQLYGPTNASPIINHVAGFAAAAQKEEMQKGAHAYFILLMLTDGVLSDMSNTKHAVVQASKLPMSIIVVGVGNADFADMEELDGDTKGLRSSNGELAKRDIVQFVPFREFQRSTSVELARHVLAEVPKQVTEYYKMRRMPPNKKAA